MVREAGLRTRRARREVMRGDASARAREALENELSRAWRVNQKIATMFLSMVTNPDLSRGLAPWAEVSTGPTSSSSTATSTSSSPRSGTRAPAPTMRAASSSGHSREDRPVRVDATLHPFNPRLVQQAMYLFMSTANRRAAEADCGHLARGLCADGARAPWRDGAASCKRNGPILDNRLLLGPARVGGRGIDSGFHRCKYKTYWTERALVFQTAEVYPPPDTICPSVDLAAWQEAVAGPLWRSQATPVSGHGR